MGSQRTLADRRCDPLVGTFNDVSGGKCPWMRGVESSVDFDPAVRAEAQLVAHQVDALLAPELEHDTTDLEPSVVARAPGRHIDPSEVVRPHEPVECPPGQLGDAILRPDAFDEVPSGREVGRAV